MVITRWAGFFNRTSTPLSSLTVILAIAVTLSNILHTAVPSNKASFRYFLAGDCVGFI
jgi:hypothetical protein